MRQASQHRIQSFAFVISVCAAVCLACCLVWNRGAGEPTGGPQAAQLEGRINPNEAPVESLVRLPGLGIGRAGAIVAYRESANREGGKPAFQNCDDLEKVRGIGPKTVQDISEWLKFD
jgi:competence ComEA-like helix-hairpin-helix protein